MKNRIDLSKFNIRTDLVIDNEIKENYINKKKINDSISVTTIEVNEELKRTLNKKIGSYITIEFEDVTNYEDNQSITKTFSTELTSLLHKKNIKGTDSCLIIGLGNRKSTA